jgi:hypothetical protein
MRYFGGAPLELPPVGPGMVCFLFFSLAASHDFIVVSGSLPFVLWAAGYGPKSLIQWASHSGTWLGPTHHISGDDPGSKGCTYGPPT